MNHPPLPPDCRFKVYERVCDTFDFKADFGFVSSDSVDGRFMIACVFGRLWLDEADRIYQEDWGDFHGALYQKCASDRTAAQENTKAWQEWGNQK